MKRIAAAGTVALAIAAVLGGVALADNGTKPAKPAAPAPKVYVCHHTGSASNPYVLIHVSSRSAPGRGENGDIVLGSTKGTCPTASIASNSNANLSSSNANANSNANAPVTKPNDEANESATAEGNENAADASKPNDEANESATAEANENAGASKANEEANENEAAEDNENDAAAPKAHESDDNEANDASENHSDSGD